jgi:hypothetical protein
MNDAGTSDEKANPPNLATGTAARYRQASIFARFAYYLDPSAKMSAIWPTAIGINVARIAWPKLSWIASPQVPHLLPTLPKHDGGVTTAEAKPQQLQPT